MENLKRRVRRARPAHLVRGPGIGEVEITHGNVVLLPLATEVAFPDAGGARHDPHQQKLGHGGRQQARFQWIVRQ